MTAKSHLKLAYREKLRRDLAALGEDPGKRQEILATIERYDSAIARLGELVDAEGAQDNSSRTPP